jgi:hypothetical protein
MRTPVRIRLVALAALAAFAATPTPASAQPGNDAGTALDGSTTTLTFERARLPARGPLGASIDGTARPDVDVTGFSYRWWALRRGRAQLGIGFGALGIDASGVPHSAYAAQTLSLGLRWRVGERSVFYADASGARPIGAEAAANNELYAAKVGVEWAASHSRFGFDKGALGLRLDSGYRMSLKVRHGGLAIYLRNQF